MRVARVEITDHPGIGYLNVDLRQSDGRAARLVVLAGENGSGKTALMEAIFAALAPTRLLQNIPLRLAPGRYRVFLELDEVSTSETFPGQISPELFGELRQDWPEFAGIVIQMERPPTGTSKADGSSWAFHQYYRASDNTATVGYQLRENVFGPEMFVFYSEASVSFDVPRVDTIRTLGGQGKQFDATPQIAFPLRRGATLAGEVAQLLVDLQTADDGDVRRWLDQHSEGRPPEDVRNRRLRRFTEAFSKIVPHKRYEGFETVSGEHRAMFSEGDFRTALGDLSTGEKQIVFRGAFLLRQADNLPGSVVLIDEPELSLHPTWQANVLSYYDHIVGEAPGRSSQVIVATHSPFVVHGSPTAKHVILRRDRSAGTVLVDLQPSYPEATATDAAVAAFDLSGFVHDARQRRLTLIVEGPTDKTILDEAWRKLRGTQPVPFTIRSADGAKNIPRLLGVGGGRSGPLLDALVDAGTILVGLFDFDHEGFAQWNGAIADTDAEPIPNYSGACQLRKRRDQQIWAALLPVPDFRTSYASSVLGSDSRLTVELLFPNQHIETLLERVPVAGDGGNTRLAARSDSQKRSVAGATTGFPTAAFAAFEPIFALVDWILASGGVRQFRSDDCRTVNGQTATSSPPLDAQPGQ